MRPTHYVMSAAVLAGIVGLGVGLGGVEDLRVAVKKGECPIEDEKCPGGLIQLTDRCLCYTTDKDDLTGELTEATASVGDLQKLLICHEQVEEKWIFRTRYVAQEASVPKECVMVAEKLPHAVSTGIPGILEAQLANACKPCVIGPKDWGVCPYCVHPDYPQICAEACPVEEE